jgi:hypothetical protein
MLHADHIHLRCPGNVGLLGCFIQISFPLKPKRPKYATGILKQKQVIVSKSGFSAILLTQKHAGFGCVKMGNQSKMNFFTASYKEVEKKLDTKKNSH